MINIKLSTLGTFEKYIIISFSGIFKLNRYITNIWQQFFGVGLVKTSEDIGAQGEVPSHRELLDDLAVSFVESGWDIKALVKQIVMSKTYRQSSRSSADQFQAVTRSAGQQPVLRVDRQVLLGNLRRLPIRRRMDDRA